MNANPHQIQQAVQDAVDGLSSVTETTHKIIEMFEDADLAIEQDRLAYEKAMYRPTEGIVTRNP